jgi:hypothetical protein
MSEICTMNYEGFKCLLRLIYSIQTVKVTWCFFFSFGMARSLLFAENLQMHIGVSTCVLMITNARFHSER